MKSSGRIRACSSCPVTGARKPPTSPLSWWSGSQQTPPDPSARSQRWIIRRFAARLPTVIRSPRGRLREPEVNCTTATSPAALGAASGSSPYAGCSTAVPAGRLGWASADAMTSFGWIVASIAANRAA